MKKNNIYKNIAKKIFNRALEEEKLIVEVSYRGGGVGLPVDTFEDYLAEILPIDTGWLWEYTARNIGCGCNYLGGGLRGAIVKGGFSLTLYEIDRRVAYVVDYFQELCVDYYNQVEQEIGLQDEDDLEWEATRKARASGIVSAY